MEAEATETLGFFPKDQFALTSFFNNKIVFLSLSPKKYLCRILFLPEKTGVVGGLQLDLGYVWAVSASESIEKSPKIVRSPIPESLPYSASILLIRTLNWINIYRLKN